MLNISDLPDRCATLQMNPAYLSRRQPHLTPIALLGDELGTDAGRSHQLPTTTDLQLDIVNHCPDGNVPNGHRISGLHVGIAGGENRVAFFQASTGCNSGFAF